MKLQNIYQKDINRSINGVIKADQNDDENLQQEFSEYIITKELRKLFEAFYKAYEKSIDTPTDKIGVWISGFFGSGKSHFLKILSYLLENKEISGKHAIDYFEDKIDDPLMFAAMKKCTQVPTESILFNVDIKSTGKKGKNAVFDAFTKVFFAHRGYFWDRRVALFEQFLDKNGKYEAFKERFEQIHGTSWEEGREGFDFFRDDIAQTVAEVLGISLVAANNWFDNNNSADYGIDNFVDDIKEYIDSKGENFRLIFCVDEMGQFMGEERDLILNLQSIVEEIGTKCTGRVWVLVTSQEAMDTITKVKAADYSKIQGRFNTRLSLTSSSVDEVIKKRILAKKEDAQLLLESQFAANSTVLKNIFSFQDARKSLRGYKDENEFVQTYPFVPYQFQLFQDTLVEIRSHSSTAQHQSSGERSMLSAFQEVAQELNDRDETALAPYYLFYKAVNSFLESDIRRVIERAQQAFEDGDGIEEYDVCVLKLLYLIKYIKDMPATLENIAVLMTDDMNVDKIDLKKKIKESLDRLFAENYIGKSGSNFVFLTNDEQDIEKEIKNEIVDSDQIISKVQSIIFEDLYMNKQIRVGKNNFGFDQYVDDKLFGKAQNPIKLRVITADSDYAGSGDAKFMMDSKANNEAICVLDPTYDFYGELETAAKIIKHANKTNRSQLSDVIVDILTKKRREATGCEKKAKELIASAIINADFYICGEKVTIAGTSVKERLDVALTTLVKVVYHKMGMVQKNYAHLADVLEIFNGQEMIGNSNPNSEAIDEVLLWIDTRAKQKRQVVMSEVLERYKKDPYGWEENDIVSVIVTLIANKSVNVVYGGMVYQERDYRLLEILSKKSEVDKAKIEKREEIDIKLRRRVKAFLIDYLDIMNISDEEDELAERIVSEFDAIRKECNDKIAAYYTSGNHYPGRDVLFKNVSVIEQILKCRKDNIALFRKVIDCENELFELAEDKQVVFSFLENHRAIFERGYEALEKFKEERFYLEPQEQAVEKIEQLEDIISSGSPYRRMHEIPGLVDEVQTIYRQLLEQKREELNKYFDTLVEEVTEIFDGDPEAKPVQDALKLVGGWKSSADKKDSITKLDAMKTQFEAQKQVELQKALKEKIGGEITPPDDPKIDAPQEDKPKVVKVSRSAALPAIKMTSADEVEEYIEFVKKYLLKELEKGDAIQIL
ncbi:MAG: BREX system P-loop protein BrxC [Clostridia bacterium]|nr:BREX system P-loop protein BrxC [Clostridia bacterium]MBR0414215.1 BREX system P-loop protein BrxC [Clostridia bacterium]